MDTTIRAIVSARKLPLSIVIVGVGDADFTSMNILDADDNPLTIVGFLTFILKLNYKNGCILIHDSNSIPVYQTIYL